MYKYLVPPFFLFVLAPAHSAGLGGNDLLGKKSPTSPHSSAKPNPSAPSPLSTPPRSAPAPVAPVKQDAHSPKNSTSQNKK